MSNVNNPHGLRPLMRRLSGGAVELEYFTKAAAYAYAIFRHDPVTRLAGVLNGPASGITPGTTLYQGVAAANSPASTLAVMGVYAHPDDLFDCQEDNSGASNVVLAKMGYNANLTTTAGGSPLTDQSNVQVSGTSIAVTGTLDVRVIRIVDEIDNDYGAYARLEVRFNKHLFTAGVTAT